MSQKSHFSVLVTATDISLHYGQKQILTNINFEIKTSQIVGVVGKNGTGKSSVLKIISKNLEPDEGKIIYTKDIKISYLAQESNIADGESTIFDFLAKSWFDKSNYISSQELILVDDIINSNNPWENLNPQNHDFLITKINNLLIKFGIYDTSKKVKNLSGGEKRKVDLARCLIVEPDLLILDEPTNHLDIASIELLENFLKSYTGGVLMVSHDRYFLDKVTTRIVEIFDGKNYDHPGNYQNYLDSKAVRQTIANVSDERKAGFLKRELEWVNAGVKARGTKDKGRLERYYDLKNQKNSLVEEKIELLLPPSSILGNKIINLENVTIENGDKVILKDFNFSFHKDTKLGIIGPNGSGKTSIIKAILEQIKLTQGRIVVGMGTRINYQDQNKLTLDPEKNPFTEIGGGSERTNFGDTTISTRKYLKRFLFDNQDILTPIKFLSGGEKSRLLLAKLLKIGGNCLILDEPTNDLDLETINLLEQSIQLFEGVAIIVSHDRYFLNKVCNNILALDGDGNFTLVLGNYNQYLTKVRPKIANLNVNVKIENPIKLMKKEEKIKQQELKKVEKEIQVLENKIKLVEEEFTQPDFYTKNPGGYGRRISHLSDLKRQLEKLMTKWEGLN